MYKYVNDTLVLLKKDRNKSKKLSREICKDGMLPFLDVMIIKKDDCLSQFIERILISDATLNYKLNFLPTIPV